MLRVSYVVPLLRHYQSFTGSLKAHLTPALFCQSSPFLHSCLSVAFTVSGKFCNVYSLDYFYYEFATADKMKPIDILSSHNNEVFVSFKSLPIKILNFSMQTICQPCSVQLAACQLYSRDTVIYQELKHSVQWASWHKWKQFAQGYVELFAVLFMKIFNLLREVFMACLCLFVCLLIFYFLKYFFLNFINKGVYIY